MMPVRISLAASVAVSLLAPVLAPAPWLIALLIVGMPAFGTLFTPAMTLLSVGADKLQLNQGLAFGISNLAWASGQGIGAAVVGRNRAVDVRLRPLCAARCRVPRDARRIRIQNAPVRAVAAVGRGTALHRFRMRCSPGRLWPVAGD